MRCSLSSEDLGDLNRPSVMRNDRGNGNTTSTLWQTEYARITPVPHHCGAPDCPGSPKVDRWG